MTRILLVVANNDAVFKTVINMEELGQASWLPSGQGTVRLVVGSSASPSPLDNLTTPSPPRALQMVQRDIFMSLEWLPPP